MSPYPTLPLTDPDMIALNRLGIITPEQQNFLRFYVPWPFWGCLGWFFLVGLFLVPFWWPGSEQLPAFMLPLYVMIFGGGAMLTTVMYGWHAWKSLRQRQEIQNGPVVWADGEVVAHGGRFEVLTPDGALKSPIQKIALIPGPYRFYYLPRSRFLLSAESLAPIIIEMDEHAAATVTHPLTPNPGNALSTLMQTFRFNENDLGRNREGRLTGRQQLRLLWSASFYAGFFLMVCLIAGLFAAANLLNLSPEPTPEIVESGLAQAWQMFCLAAFGLFAFGWPLWNLVTRLIDILRGQVQMVSGPIHFQVRGGRGTTSYYVVRGKEFQVSPYAYYSFIEGMNYHLYYTPLAKEIASLEPVGRID